MPSKWSRALAGMTLFSIVIYGILKIWVLHIFSEIIIWVSSVLGLSMDSIFGYLRSQALKEENGDRNFGWLLYYPTYFLLHILFIFLLFANNKKVRNSLMIGLTAIIFLLISTWIISGWLGLDTLAFAARKQFRNLFGLPFILLAIEGGRILYNDLIKLTKDQKSA